MLLRLETLQKIQAGEVSLVFRRWRRPTVISGGTLKTRIGMLSIEAIDRIALSSLTASDAKRAGFASKAALMVELSKREGDVYRIAVAFAGEDPRIALRENSKLSDSELKEILARLERFDAASRSGAWTFRTMQLIDENPERLSAELAAEMGYEKPPFKRNVRKLKELGLTISQKVGYTLSPRGKAVYKRLRKDGKNSR